MSLETLGPWRAALRGVDPELIPAAEAMAERLWLFFGPYPLPGSGDDGEPQGYFGLERRGPYERLLTSEWAMLEAAPLEFLRRAVAGEQLFFALSRRRPAGGRRCVALVDAGPEQLGNCRLAQLALLMVLAERSRAAGAQFLWSSWQAPPGDHDEGFEGGALRRFLEQRSPHMVAPEMRQAWLALLGAPAAEEERWSIGGADAGQCAGLQWVAIGENEQDIACRSLTVEWRPPGRPRKSIELPLPPETARIRLLKDPYQRLEPAKAMQPRNPKNGLLESPIESISFGCRDERLLVRTATELEMIVFGARPFDQQPGGRPRSFRFEQGEKLVAAGSADAFMAVVLRRENELCFHRVPKGRDRDHRPVVVVQSSRGQPAAGHGNGVCVPDPKLPLERWYFQDGLRAVHVYNFPGQRFEASLDEVDALFAPRGGGVEAVRALHFPEHLRFHDGDWKRVWSCDGAEWSHAFAGPGGAMAFELGDNLWAVDSRKLRPDPRCEVVGVAKTKKSQLAGLLLLGSEKLELHHEGLSFRRFLVKARSPIRGVAVGVQQPVLAYWTARGGLELVSLEDGRSRTLIEEPE
jgi:hypothetical protein